MSFKIWRCDKHQNPLPAAQFCIECGVAYQARPTDDWPSYCTRCRQPKAELKALKDLVLLWAEATFEQHEETAKKWKADEEAKWKADAADANSHYAQRMMQNQMQMPPFTRY